MIAAICATTSGRSFVSDQIDDRVDRWSRIEL
jgi:hypothetical protein